jgi:glycosyltransferase involved in cell wall biosynthesis
MAAKLTVLIPCKNERSNIRSCIESVRNIADEILVADSGSTDDTIEIARGLGCRIIEREYINSADFKNWAIPQAENEWVLVVDADERATPELASEIRKVLSLAHPMDGYRVAFRTFFLGYELKHGGWSTGTSLRLFRRECRYQKVWVHADVVVTSGRVGKLKHKFLHYTYWSLEQYFEKFNRYTSHGARDMRARGRKPSVLNLLLHPPTNFLKFYILRGGFLDGVPGFLMSALSAYYSFVKHAKLWALAHGYPRPEPVAEPLSEAVVSRAA